MCEQNTKFRHDLLCSIAPPPGFHVFIYRSSQVSCDTVSRYVNQVNLDGKAGQYLLSIGIDNRYR